MSYLNSIFVVGRAAVEHMVSCEGLEFISRRVQGFLSPSLLFRALSLAVQLVEWAAD